jgi:outer membrane receptor protein involved in Fe transport
MVAKGLLLLGCMGWGMGGFLSSEAQTSPMDTLLLPEIKVLGSKKGDLNRGTPYALDKSLLKERKSAHLAEVLSQSTPLFVKSYGLGGLSTASFRGTMAAHTKVFWQGMPIHSPMVGQLDLSLLPVFFVDAISVLPGSAGMKEGSGALGGVLSLESQAQSTQGWQSNLLIEAGSFGSQRAMGRLDFTRGRHSWTLRGMRMKAENDFPFRNTARIDKREERQRNAQLAQWGILSDYYYRAKDNSRTSAHLWWQKSQRNLPPIMSFAGAGRTEFQNDHSLRALFLHQRSLGRQGMQQIRLGYNQMNLDYHLSHNTPLGRLVNYDSGNRAHSVFGRYDAEVPDWKGFQWRGKLDLQRDEVALNNLGPLGDFTAERNNLGMQAQVSRLLGSGIEATGMVRREWVSQIDLPWMYAFHLGSAGGEKKDDFWRLALSRNAHVPTLNDLFWIPGGNPNLRPEQGFLWELTGRKRLISPKGSWDLGLEFYQSFMRDWILWMPGEFGFWTATNVQKVWTRGVEASLLYQRVASWGGYEARAMLALHRTTERGCEGQRQEFCGRQMVYVPLVQGSFHHIFRYKNWSMLHQLQYTGRRNTSFSLTQGSVLPAFALQHLRLSRALSKSWAQVEAYVDLQNITNVQYQALLWRAMPGRYGALGLEIVFGKSKKEK